MNGCIGEWKKVSSRGNGADRSDENGRRGRWGVFTGRGWEFSVAGRFGAVVRR